MERQTVSVQLFSSLKKQGIDEVEQVVQAWFSQLPAPETAEDQA